MQCFSDNSVGMPETLTDASFGEGTGPIFLDRLTCKGSENSLLNLNCSREGSLGVTSCTHVMDVSVRCPGMMHIQKYLCLYLHSEWIFI